jgi:hypothetical protein
MHAIIAAPQIAVMRSSIVTGNLGGIVWADLAHLRGNAWFGPTCRGGVGGIVGIDHHYRISS